MLHIVASVASDVQAFFLFLTSGRILNFRFSRQANSGFRARSSWRVFIVTDRIHRRGYCQQAFDRAVQIAPAKLISQPGAVGL